MISKVISDVGLYSCVLIGIYTVVAVIVFLIGDIVEAIRKATSRKGARSLKDFSIKEWNELERRLRKQK